MKSVLILAICLIFIENISAQSILKIPAIVKDERDTKYLITPDENVEEMHLYKNVPTQYINSNFKYLFVDPVQGVYEKLMIDTKQPERWQRFKSRFSIPDSIGLYPKKLLNNKLAIFYGLDAHQNGIIIIDKNGNNDLSDDEVMVIKKDEISNKEISIDIPIEVYNSRLNSINDSVINLGIITSLNSNEKDSSKLLGVSFFNTKNMTAEVKTNSHRYIFNWLPHLTQNRKYLFSDQYLIFNMYDENSKFLKSELLKVGDTIIMENQKMIISQYNREHLILEKGAKETIGYSLGQILKPTSGIDLFNPQKKIELISNRYLVIDFWGSWCGPCIAAMPELVEFEKKYKGKVDLISVASDRKSDIELAKKIVNDHKLTWPQVWDDRANSTISKPMKIQSFPSLVVVDKNKKIVFITSSIEKLEEFLEKAK